MISKAKVSAGATFRHFDPLHHAKLALEHLTGMTDPKLGFLPYGQVLAYAAVPFAEHSRQDDAEFAASWFEGISCAREMLGTEEGKDVEDALRAMVLDPACWDAKTGLRFPKKRAWTGPYDYATISEMAPVLSALNRMIETNPKDKDAAARAKGLIKGLRALVTEHKARLTPAGEFPVETPVYTFQADVVLRGKGFAPEYSTGFADATMRVSTLIHPIMVHYDLTKDKASLDLALGLANRIVAFSHFFSNKTEFQGEVHSALVAAAGLARVGRVLSLDRYVARAKSLYDFVRRNSSAFGWVPEHLQWQLIADEVCPATNTVDMMTLALELVECSFPEYWDDVHRFWRNHLVQAQFEDTSFVPAVKPLPADTAQRTYKNIPGRLRGAFCGATNPSFIFLGKRGIVSARASAAGPRGMLWAWRHAIDLNRDLITINFPIDIETPYAKVSVGYPEEGTIRIDLKKDCRINLRVYPWMSTPHEGTVAGRPAALERREDHIAFPKCKAGTAASFRHDVKTRRILENITSLDFFGLWRGPDMVDILPHSTGAGYRLYRQALSAAADPVPKALSAATEIDRICEPPVSKETRLNRRKAPRA